MTPVTPWKVTEGALTLLWRRPGLALLAIAPEFCFEVVDALWIEPMADQMPWLGLLELPLGVYAYAWTFAILGAAWEAAEHSPAAVTLARWGPLARATAWGLFVFLIGAPLIFPALYYFVHYFYVPLVAVRDPAQKSLAILRRSKLLARKHRRATALFAFLLVLFGAGIHGLFDWLALSKFANAFGRSAAISFAILLLAALSAQAYARWKAIDTPVPQT